MSERVLENLCLDILLIFRICKYFNFSLMKSKVAQLESFLENATLWYKLINCNFPELCSKTSTLYYQFEIGLLLN